MTLFTALLTSSFAFYLKMSWNTVLKRGVHSLEKKHDMI
jgi:hypothetical protein